MAAVRAFTSNDGTAIGCFVSGSGPPIVLVHGTAADHARWRPILPTLERSFTVYACDRRGRGASGAGEPYALEREFEDVAAIVEGIGGSVDVLAHSHGGLCALEAARLTTHLRRLVLYEPLIPAGRPLNPRQVVERLRDLLERGDNDGVVSTFMLEIVRVAPEQLATMKKLPAWPGRVAAAPSIVRELQAQQNYELRVERFHEVKVPTLLLLGGASPPFFKAAVETVQRALRDTRLVVLAGQTHVAIDAAPDLFAREVLAFLEA